MKLRLTHIYIILFIIVAYTMLPIMNSDYLYTIEENSLYVGSKTIMTDLVTNNGGLWSLVSCYLTQFFYHPWLGSTILIALWTMIYYMSTYITSKLLPSLSNKWHFILLLPLFALLYDVLNYGYALYYTKNIGFPFKLTIAVTVTWAIFFLISLFIPKNKKEKKVLQAFAVALLSPIFIVFLSKNNPKGFWITVSDTNFRKELKMYRALDDRDWQKVLEISPKITEKGHVRPTNLMVLYKNIALMNKGELLSDMLMYDCRGVAPTQKDLEKLSISRIAAPMLYYYFGQTNFAYRWAIENSVKYNINFDNLKMMIRCAMFNREFELAQKYINILKSSIFHKKWAKQYEAMLYDNALFIQSTEFQTIYPLMDVENELEGDDGDIEAFIYGYFSNYLSKNPRIEELSIMSSLQIHAVEEFMIHFYHYTLNHPDEPVPTIMQEAAYMFGPLDINPIDVSRFAFDQASVIDRFMQFRSEVERDKSNGMSDADIANKSIDHFGETYWWFYNFYKDHKAY